MISLNYLIDDIKFIIRRIKQRPIQYFIINSILAISLGFAISSLSIYKQLTQIHHLLENKNYKAVTLGVFKKSEEFTAFNNKQLSDINNNHLFQSLIFNVTRFNTNLHINNNRVRAKGELHSLGFWENLKLNVIAGRLPNNNEYLWSGKKITLLFLKILLIRNLI